MSKPFPKQEYYELSQEMEKYHEIFSCLWRITEPSFTDNPKIDTAAVSFDNKGACINFEINEDYWNSLDDYNKEFTICHEMLHVILAHGARMIPFRDKYDNKTLNVALDLAVNHLLTNSFGFNRYHIQDWQTLCWADTVFNDALDLSPNKAFEYYINKIEPNKDKINKRIGVKCHDYLTSFDQNTNNKILDASNAVSNNLDEDQKKEQKDQLQKQLDGCLKQGNGQSISERNIFSLYTGRNIVVKKIKKWESVLDKYIRKSETEREFTQWVRMNRRMAFINSQLMLPSDAEIIDKDFYKYNIWLFLDYSGSCYRLKDMFFSASKTFDPRKFNVRKFAHTESVSEFDGDNCRIRGGGTCFRCIENYIQQQIKEEKIKSYPDAIFHFTDGVGTTFETPHPERWYAFLTHNYRVCYPSKVNFFKLADFVENYNDPYRW